MIMEISILDAIQSLHTPWLNAVMKFFTFLGNAGWFWIAITVILLILPKTRIWGLTMGTALLLGQVIGCVIMKQLVARPRPYNSPDALVTASQLLIRELKDYSFPSGHTQASFASAAVIWRMNRKAGAAAFAVAGLIAFSRMYFYVHYPTDVCTGAVLGLIWAWISVRFFRPLYERAASALREKKQK
jgi:undecaprenyl-diphosphatase